MLFDEKHRQITFYLIGHKNQLLQNHMILNEITLSNLKV
jgi:hypothetical protein